MLYEGTRDFLKVYLPIGFKPEETVKAEAKEKAWPKYLPAFEKVSACRLSWHSTALTRTSTPTGTSSQGSSRGNRTYRIRNIDVSGESESMSVSALWNASFKRLSCHFAILLVYVYVKAGRFTFRVWPGGIMVRPLD